jgi:hypothetical protein
MTKSSNVTNLTALMLATVAFGLLARSSTSASASATPVAAAAAAHQSASGRRDTFDEEAPIDDGRRETEYQLMAESDDELADAMTRWYLTQQQARLGVVGDGVAVPVSVDDNSGESL